MGNVCSCVRKNKEGIDNEGNILLRPTKDNQENTNNASSNNLKEDNNVIDPLYPPPPSDFKPEILDPLPKDVSPLESELPNVDGYKIPPRTLDEIAITLSKHNFTSFMPLIYHLIYNRPDDIKSNEYQKVRALFTWLTTTNVHNLHFVGGVFGPDTPEAILMGISSGKTAYAQAFQILCRYAGLKCKLIRGYAKGVDYKPGMKLGTGTEAQHAWNAVQVDNIWYLFDCHWAARRLMGKADYTDGCINELDMFYFMTNPLHLRYTHFPFDGEWQLLRKQISLDEFEVLTLVKPTFFKYDLELFSHTQAVLEIQNKLTLMIKMPITLVDKLCLTFTLTLEGLGETFEGTNLTRYGIQDTNKNTAVCTINFRFPKSGSYKLLLYAREYGDQVFGGICEYRVNASLPEVEVVDGSGQSNIEEFRERPYPPTQQPAYGKTEMAYKYNIKCSLDDCIITTVSDGVFEVSFSKEDQDKYDFPRLMGRLKSSCHDDSKLISKLIQRNTYEGNIPNKYIILEFLPDPGEYALEVYANNPEKEGSSFFLVWQLFICTDKGSNLPVGLPDVNPVAAIGSQPQFHELGIKLLSHPDPYIIVLASTPSSVSENGKHDLIVSIGFPLPNTIKVLGQLVDVSSVEEELECSDFLLQQSFCKEKCVESISFCLRFPRGGCFYKLHIYAACATTEIETLPMVFSYLINVPNMGGSMEGHYNGEMEGSYPYQLSMWKEKCRLFEPINRNIKFAVNSDKLRFTLEIVGAFYVAVVSLGEHWTQLSKSGESLWSGSVEITSSMPAGSKISVCACYNELITSYNTILEYYII